MRVVEVLDIRVTMEPASVGWRVDVEIGKKRRTTFYTTESDASTAALEQARLAILAEAERLHPTAVKAAKLLG